MRPLETWAISAASPLLQHPASRSTLFVTQKTLCPRFSPARALALKTIRHPVRKFTVSAPSHSLPTSSLKPTFSYRIGASFSAKGRRFDPKKDVFTFNSQAESKSGQEIFTGRPNSGQDAFFVSRVGNSNNVAFGVADGVGGWSDQGIDSAKFSHGLCLGMAKAAGELHLLEKKDLPPQVILDNAYQEIVREGEIQGGGSTACVATGDEEGNLKVAK